MSKLTESLEPIANDVRAVFTSRDNSREKALPLSREVIRYASVTIRAIHRQELAEAREMLSL